MFLLQVFEKVDFEGEKKKELKREGSLEWGWGMGIGIIISYFNGIVFPLNFITRVIFEEGRKRAQARGWFDEEEEMEEGVRDQRRRTEEEEMEEGVGDQSRRTDQHA